MNRPDIDAILARAEGDFKWPNRADYEEWKEANRVIVALCKYVKELEAMFMPIVDKQAHWQGFEDKR